MCVNSNVRHLISIILHSQGAEAAPPLGTVLGNLGVMLLSSVKSLMSLLVNYLNILR